MKRGCPTHPKTFDLAEKLGIKRAHAVGLLELLFHFTAQYAPQGDVGRFSDKRLAAALDWGASPAKLVSSLVEAGWLDHHPTVRLVVHDWEEHSDRTTMQRLARTGKQAIKSNQPVTAKVCTKVDDAGDPNITLPEPEPLPEPLPEPKPAPVDRASTISKHGGFPEFPETPPEKWALGQQLRDLWDAGGKSFNHSDEMALELFYSRPLNICENIYAFAQYSFRERWPTPAKTLPFHKYVESGAGESGVPIRKLPSVRMENQSRLDAKMREI